MSVLQSIRSFGLRHTCLRQASAILKRYTPLVSHHGMEIVLLDKDEFRRMSRERFPLSDGQADQLFTKHDLGKLDWQRFVGGNFTNSVFDCHAESGDSYILKIQFRAGNQPLQADRDVTQLLTGSLPVAPICLLDNDRDVIPHATFILSKLEGTLAESVFESSAHQTRV